jgi:phosphate transport system substrate-binding protein
MAFVAVAASASAGVVGVGERAASATAYVPISGAGSTWSQNAIDQFIVDVKQYGMRVNYAGTGSSDGRQEFLKGTVDFAASDIPFQTHPEDGSAPENPAAGSYAYMPITAGGTVFMYNLKINGQRVTNLRLSGANIAKIFTGQITRWNDPAIQADNPGLTLPATTVVPVVRSDGSGSTAQFTLWMIAQQNAIWTHYCSVTGRSATCGETSYYPTVSGMVAQSGDLGVAGYIAQSYANGAIGYVNYSYALNAGFPVAKMLNAAGYYTQPTPDNVAVSLLQAKVDTTDVNDPSKYLTQDLSQVYVDPDPRTYPLSSYSYLILPTTVQGQFTTAKGATLGAFSYYAMCQGQQESASLGYSPMPINLVQASFAQITKIPGVIAQNINIQSCHNPTFDANGTNLLATQDPYPPACDKQGPTQCASGTGGATASTPEKPGTQGSTSPSRGGTTTRSAAGGSGGGSGTGGGAGGSTGSGGASSGATGSSVAAAGGSGSSSSGQSAQSCDPSTQTCALSASDSSGSGSASLQPATATLPAKGSWGETQTLMLLVGFLIVAVLLAPGLTARYLREQDRK